MTETLLVVDDDPGLRSLYEAWLAEYEVRLAADGAEALDRLDAAVDVVVLDREMPRVDGVTVARKLQTKPVDPAVVMVSSVAPDTDLLDIPVDDYLQKPVEGEAVTAAVRRGLALTESPDGVRDLLSLDTRLDIVEASVDTSTLTESDAYERATADREARMAALSRARPTVFPADGDTEAAPDRLSARHST